MPEKVHDVKLGESADDITGPSVSGDTHINPTGGSSSRAPSMAGSDSAELRSGSSFGSRGAMSFAAAAMAGLAAGNGRSMRGGRDRHGRLLIGSNDPPRLIFSAGGKQLNRHLTIYQAIQKQLVLEEDDDERFGGGDFTSSDGNRLWSDIYTITYQKADNQAENASIGTMSSANQSKSAKDRKSVV